MEQPGRLHSLFKALPAESDPSTFSITGHPAVDEVLRTLSGADLARLLRYVQNWNAKAKTSVVAQRVLHAIVKQRAAEDIMNAFDQDHTLAKLTDDLAVTTSKAGDKGGATALRELIEALAPYTERHLARLERLVQESYVVDYLLGEMDGGMFGLDDDMEEEDVMDVDTAVGVVA